MKYLLMAVAAGTMIACNESPDDDRMGSPQRDVDQGQQRIDGSPDLRDVDERRRHADEMNRPEDVVPFDHEIRNDSLITPTDRPENSSKLFENEMPANMRTNHGVGTQPVMPKGGTTHHSSGSLGTVEGDTGSSTRFPPATTEGMGLPPDVGHRDQDSDTIYRIQDSLRTP
jgi:hypothetical protein